MDVSALAGWVIGPYPLRYRAAFASSTFLPRTSIGWPYGSLCPEGRRHGFLKFVVSSLLNHLGPTRTPVTQHLRGATLEHPDLATHLLVQACQHLGLVTPDGAAVVRMC